MDNKLNTLEGNEEVQGGNEFRAASKCYSALGRAGNGVLHRSIINGWARNGRSLVLW
jgi:hypothetical protein